MFILIVGNAADGLTFIGPWWVAEAATEFAEQNVRDTWIVVDLVYPADAV
jgi:hypothetical protein